MENQIVEVKLTLHVPNGGRWTVSVTKQFAKEHGGGAQTFTENGGPNIHTALDVARGMVTLSPGRRTDLGEASWYDPQSGVTPYER